MNGLFLSLILTILFISCNKDDNNSKTLVGTWACVASSDNLTIAEYTKWEHGAEGSIYIDRDDFSTYDTSITDYFKGDNVIFREDGYCESGGSEVSWYYYDFDYFNQYFYECISLGDNFGILGDEYGGSWCIIENQLYIDKNEYIWDIQKFTKSELIISTTNEVQDSHGNKYKNRHTRTFKKQS